MKKSIFSKVAAAVLAGAMVLGMATTAFAAGEITLEGYEKSDEYGSFMDMTEMVDDVSKVATCEIVIEGSEQNGCVVVSANSTGWAWTPVNFGDVAVDNGDGTFTVAVECALDASDDLVKILVQDWSANKDAVVKKVVLKDSTGAVLFPEESAGGNDTPTGDSAAATALILAAVAALAVAATVSVKKFAVER